MKKIIFICICLCLLLQTIVLGRGLIMRRDTNNDVKLFISDVEIRDGDRVIIQDNEMLVPFRTVFESLGSKVVWEEATKSIYFDFAEEEYICQFVILNDSFPDFKSILICKVENKGSIYNSEYIQLNPWAADGTYFIIDDKTYINQQTAEYLFKYLGCRLEVDIENSTIKITGRDV